MLVDESMHAILLEYYAFMSIERQTHRHTELQWCTPCMRTSSHTRCSCRCFQTGSDSSIVVDKDFAALRNICMLFYAERLMLTVQLCTRTCRCLKHNNAFFIKRMTRLSQNKIDWLNFRNKCYENLTIYVVLQFRSSNENVTTRGVIAISSF